MLKNLRGKDEQDVFWFYFVVFMCMKDNQKNVWERKDYTY